MGEKGKKYLALLLRIFSVGILMVLTFAFIIIFTICISIWQSDTKVNIKNGELDLSKTDFKNIDTLKLNGKWGVYPEIYIDENNVSSLDKKEEVFEEFTSNEIFTSKDKATYRLNIKTDRMMKNVVLFIPNYPFEATVLLDKKPLKKISEEYSGLSKLYRDNFIYELDDSLLKPGNHELLVSINYENGENKLFHKEIIVTTQANAKLITKMTTSYIMFTLGLMLILMVSGCMFMFLVPNHKLISLITLFDFTIMLRLLFDMKEFFVFLKFIFPDFYITESTIMCLKVCSLMIGGIVGCFLSHEIFDKEDKVPKKFTRPLPYMYGALAILFCFNIRSFSNVGKFIILPVYAYTSFIVIWQFYVCLKSNKTKKGYKFFQIVKTLYVMILICLDIFTFELNENIYLLIILYMAFFIGHLFTKILDNQRYYNDVLQFNKNLENIVEERTYELKEANKILFELSIKDTLTQVYNRLHFEKCFDYAMKCAKSVHLCMFDLDHFKSINDTYGHDAGDKQLKLAVEIVNDNLNNNGTIFRVGGEEFAILFINSNMDVIRRQLETIRIELEEKAKENPMYTTASFGVAKYSPKYTKEEYLKIVDNCLYRAKEQGRNCIVEGSD